MRSKKTQKYQIITLLLVIACMASFLLGLDALDGVFDSEDDGPEPEPRESVQRFGEILLTYVLPSSLVLFGIFAYLFVRQKEIDNKEYFSRPRDELLGSGMDNPSEDVLSFCPDCGKKLINRVGSSYQWCEKCKKHI